MLQNDSPSLDSLKARFEEILPLCGAISKNITQSAKNSQILMTRLSDIAAELVDANSGPDIEVSLIQIIGTAIKHQNIAALQIIFFLLGSKITTAISEVAMALALHTKSSKAIFAIANHVTDALNLNYHFYKVLGNNACSKFRAKDILAKDSAGNYLLEYAVCVSNYDFLRHAVAVIGQMDTLTMEVLCAICKSFPWLIEDRGSSNARVDDNLSTITKPLVGKLYPDKGTETNIQACTSSDIKSALKKVRQTPSQVRLAQVLKQLEGEKQEAEQTKDQDRDINRNKDRNAHKDISRNEKRSKGGAYKQISDKYVWDICLSRGKKRQDLLAKSDSYYYNMLLQSNDYSSFMEKIFSIYQKSNAMSYPGAGFSCGAVLEYLANMNEHSPLRDFYRALLSGTYPNVCLHYIDFELYYSSKAMVIPSEIGLVKTYRGRPVYMVQGLFRANLASAPSGQVHYVKKITGIEPYPNFKRFPWLRTLSYIKEQQGASVADFVAKFLQQSPQELDTDCDDKSPRNFTPVTGANILPHVAKMLHSFRDNNIPFVGTQPTHDELSANPTKYCKMYKHFSGLYVYRFNLDLEAPLPQFPNVKYECNGGNGANIPNNAQTTYPVPLRDKKGNIVLFAKALKAEADSLAAMGVTGVSLHEVQMFFSPFIPPPYLSAIAHPVPGTTEPFCIDHHIIIDQSSKEPKVRTRSFHCALYDAVMLTFCAYNHLSQVLSPAKLVATASETDMEISNESDVEDGIH